MRILAVHPGPEFSVQDVYDGWVEALKSLGNKVLGFNLADRLNFYDGACLPTAPGEYKKALTAEQAPALIA